VRLNRLRSRVAGHGKHFGFATTSVSATHQLMILMISSLMILMTMMMTDISLKYPIIE